MRSSERAELVNHFAPTTKLFNKIYDSIYAPGPIVQTGAFIVGAYIGLAIPAVIFKKLNWI